MIYDTRERLLRL